MALDPFALELARSAEYQNLTSQERADLANTKRIPRQDHTLHTYRSLVTCRRLGDTLAARDALISQFSGALKASPGTAWKADQLTGEGWDFADPDMQASLTAMAQAGFSAEGIAKIKSVGIYSVSDYEAKTGEGQVATAEMFDEADAFIARDVLLAHVNDRRNAALDAITSGTVSDLAALKSLLGA